MNVFDIFIIILLSLFTIRGIFRGLITELMVLTALIVGFIAAMLFLDPAVFIITRLVPDLPEVAAKIISFIGIFVLVNIAARLVGAMLNKFVTVTFLQPVNRFAGGAFAFLKVAFILSLLILLVDSIPILSKYVFSAIGSEQSITFYPLKSLAPLLYKFITVLLPGEHDLQQRFMNTLQAADSTATRFLNP